MSIEPFPLTIYTSRVFVLFYDIFYLFVNLLEIKEIYQNIHTPPRVSFALFFAFLAFHRF